MSIVGRDAWTLGRDNEAFADFQLLPDVLRDVGRSACQFSFAKTVVAYLSFLAPLGRYQRTIGLQLNIQYIKLSWNFSSINGI